MTSMEASSMADGSATVFGHASPTMTSMTAFLPAHAGHGPAPLDVPLKIAIARAANGISPASVIEAHTDWFLHLLVSPSKQTELWTSALQKSLCWLEYLARANQVPVEECVHPAPQDKRFSHREWQAQPFHALAQAFLLQQQWWDEAAHGVRGVSRHHEDVTAFMLRQWLDMWSPSNFVATNPQVLKHTLDAGASNLATGFANWSRDALAVLAGGKPRGVEEFRPGKAVALTPGQVVMRNDLIELIRYEPATPQVYKEPVLIVPSWIMKYYILDLTPDDSLVRYLVEQGHTVFMLSWKNPSAQDSGLTMGGYLELGVMEALRAVQAERPHIGIHAMGYCLGGTLLAAAAAVLSAKHKHPLKTISLLAAQVDFREPGELGLFVDESQIAFLEDLMAESGYLDGRRMAGAFQLINSKDLVWSKLVHEYLMGATTPMTALRAWNADATRMPARMHGEYLRRLYLHNDLAEGRFRVNGTPVSLDDIHVPMFVTATERDHVSPWHSVYKIMRLTHAPVAFALTSGGHNVGIVNPPIGPLAHPEATYRFATHAPRQAPADAQQWFDEAAQLRGSWWPCWQKWLAQHSSGRIAAKPMRPGLMPAPGSYVFQE